MLTKLLFRTLPDYYPAGSTYAHFPFLVPSKMKSVMQAKGEADLYIWDRVSPSVSKGLPAPGTDFPRSQAGYISRVKDVTGVQISSLDEVSAFAVQHSESVLT